MQANSWTKRRSESLLTGSIIAAFLVASPYFFYLYEGVPDIPVWNFSILGLDFRYDSNFYYSVNVVAWIVMGKIVPLILFLIWFFTCKHWWYHAILVPICMYVIQIYLTFQEDTMRTQDITEIYLLAPIILLAFVFIYVIRTKIFDKIHNIDLAELQRGSLKGDIKENKKDPYYNYSPSSFVIEDEEVYHDEDDEDEDDEPLYMG
ncbi:hypothetical protein ACH3O9_15710 [Leeuwenhoekiella sp. A16]|uniref:hypothetical protein n=1 Tax=unclassified Leeuwenhoekiella TaxID=2615029 RepID=UPI003A8029AC